MDIKKIAELARMNLTDAETQRFEKEISGVLQNFKDIQAIDTENIPSADDVSGLKNVMREDVAINNTLADPKELLKNASTHNGYVKVSAVFAEETVS